MSAKIAFFLGWREYRKTRPNKSIHSLAILLLLREGPFGVFTLFPHKIH
jgi:hypothetical protein